MNKEDPYDLWKERVEACTRSGKSARAWCHEQGLSESTYYRWEKRVHRQEEEMTSTGMMKTNSDPETTACTEIPADETGTFVEIHLQNTPPEKSPCPAAVLKKGELELEIYPELPSSMFCRILEVFS